MLICLIFRVIHFLGIIHFFLIKFNLIIFNLIIFLLDDIQDMTPTINCKITSDSPTPRTPQGSCTSLPRNGRKVSASFC